MAVNVLDKEMGVIVLNAFFNNISVISWQSVLLVEKTGVPGEIHWPAKIIIFCTEISQDMIVFSFSMIWIEI